MQSLVRRIAPELAAHALVHAFSERFGQAVGQRLGHDRGVIVVGVLEAVGEVLLADARGHREGADIIGEPAGTRRDEIGKRDVGAALAAGELLAQACAARRSACAASRRRRREYRRRRCSPAKSRSPRAPSNQRSATIRCSIACASANSCRAASPTWASSRRAGILAVQFPGGEERRPVDEVDKLRQRRYRPTAGYRANAAPVADSGPTNRAVRRWRGRPRAAGAVCFLRRAHALRRCGHIRRGSR